MSFIGLLRSSARSAMNTFVLFIEAIQLIFFIFIASSVAFKQLELDSYSREFFQLELPPHQNTAYFFFR